MVFIFHTCINCGKRIIPERLEILPETRLCKNCSEKMGSDMIVPETKVGMDPDTYKDLLGAVRS
ncbi:TraR/DksA C4-type zinc finger protein [Halothermothrix orenii]|uniref:TraR/DksA C4-type zinc finger protein n=1 Tax=Halothermothrix orenii TaxID=31909 RepID=UPI000315EE28|nr:TraR/DksA C4-type zinc finger protein [Halothermothrix orenii]